MSVKRSPFCKMRLRLKFILADAALQAILKFQKLIRLNIHQRHGESPLYSCSNITTTLNLRSKSKLYKAQKVQKCALNSQLQALQILINDDEVEN